MGVSPAQQVSCSGRVNRSMSPISATSYGGQGRADPGDLLHRGIARVGREPAPHHAGDMVDLEIEQVHHPAQRPDPGRIGRREVQPVQQRGALDAEQVTHRHLHPALGQHRMDLGLAV